MFVLYVSTESIKPYKKIEKIKNFAQLKITASIRSSEIL